MIPKIADRHLSRQACIYIRQSTLAQVRFNQESTDRQYNLMNKARSLGWSQEQIRVLDRDLGKSGAAASTRTDFKTLVGDVAMGHVGAIFSLEASRLARSNQDWHRLLELCAITGTVVIDEDGVYDPADFNDGLVLGMKGTFAQAELHIIRARLHGGKLNKASRGDLRFALPVGLIFDEDKIVLDPDQEVQGAVRTVFELFAREGTAFGVVQRFQELGLRFPRRAYGGAWNGKLIWGRLTHSRVLGILANPSYAGTYMFGRYQSSKQVGPSGEISTRSRPMPQEAWRVTIRDHHEGYINWDQFAANRRRLASNRTNVSGWLVQHERDFACCRACLCAAFADGAWACAIPAMVASTDISMRLEAPRGAGSAGLPLGASSSARSVDYQTVGWRHHAGDDRTCTRCTHQPGTARSRDRRAVAHAHRTSPL